MNAPKRLIVISFGAIGDALMLLALLDAVHAAYPKTALHFFAARNGSVPKAVGGEYGFVTFSDLKTLSGIKNAFLLAASRNMVLVPPSFGKVPLHIKGFALLLSRVPGSRAVGFRDDTGFNPYHRACSYDSQSLAYENFRRSLAPEFLLDAKVPRYRPRPEPHLFPRLQLAQGAYVVLHPFAANPKRGLPLRRWRSLVAHLHKTYPHLSVVVTGSAGDASAAQDIARAGARSLAGALSLSETAALVGNAALYIGVDTGITHLAALMRVPSVIVGNRSNPSWLPAYNENARILTKDGPCGCMGDKRGNCAVVEDSKEYFRCAYDVSDAAINEAVREKLAGQGEAL